MRRTDTSGGGWAFDDGDEPTRNDSIPDTAPHNLVGPARVVRAAAVIDDRDRLISFIWNEALEEGVRALYDLLRHYQQPADWSDNFVLAFRQRLTRL